MSDSGSSAHGVDGSGAGDGGGGDNCNVGDGGVDDEEGALADSRA